MFADIPETAAILAAVIALASSIWWLWWKLPKLQADSYRLQIRDAKDRADIEDAYRKTIGQLIGGAAVLIGAGLAYYQTLLTQRASHDQLISQQVSKGFEQLASDDLPIQLGGVYALEYVMNKSEYHKPVLEALCAFVRERTKPTPTTAAPLQGKTSEPPAENGALGPTPPAIDIQTVLTVIGRRDFKTDVVDLRAAHIPKANLSGASLSKADLSKADLSEANLSEADLNGANLNGAKLDGADLREADLIGAHLRGAFLRKADLRGEATKLNDADLTEKADLSEAKVSDADLSGAILTNAILTNATLTGTRLNKAHLMGAHLIGANLRGAILTDAHLSGADLSGATLTGPYVTQNQLNEACGDKTKLPQGLTIKPCARQNQQNLLREP